jgi:hypothetical protein
MTRQQLRGSGGRNCERASDTRTTSVRGGLAGVRRGDGVSVALRAHTAATAGDNARGRRRCNTGSLKNRLIGQHNRSYPGRPDW